MLEVMRRNAVSKRASGDAKAPRDAGYVSPARSQFGLEDLAL